MSRIIFKFLLALGLITAVPGHAYVVHEIEPGILEMRAIQDKGLEVQNVFVDKKHHWIYFEVREARDETRYFYAPTNELSLGKTKRLRFLQYGIGKRIFNSHGKIPFGPQRFFYPLVYFQTVS